jgi:hypothetical protein
MILIPRCHPLNGKIKKQYPALTATGHLLPCCECDTISNKEFSDMGFFDDSLHISNVEKIEQIIISPQWLKFHKMLLQNPETAPAICKKICSKTIVEEELSDGK